MSRNDITGDQMVSKANTKAYSEGYDRIFGAKKKMEPVRQPGSSNCPHCKEEHSVVNGSCMYCNKTS